MKLSYVSPKTISELCEDLVIPDSMPDHWRQRYTPQMSDHMKAELVLDTIRKVILSWVEDTSVFVEVTFPKVASITVIGAAGMHRRK